MGIQGTTSPKFITSGDVTVELRHFVVTKNDENENILTHNSEIDGDRGFYLKGSHYVFEGYSYIYKLDDPLAEFQKLRLYLGQDVTLYMHSDGEPFKDSNGDVVPFTLLRVSPYYPWDDEFGQDNAVYLAFKSTKYVDLSQSTKEEYIKVGGVDVEIGGVKIKI